MESPRPDQEGFGEAELGEAQSENPPADPEMLEDEAVDERVEAADEALGTEGGAEEAAERGEEAYGGDQDAEPASGDGT